MADHAPAPSPHPSYSAPLPPGRGQQAKRAGEGLARTEHLPPVIPCEGATAPQLVKNPQSDISVALKRTFIILAAVTALAVAVSIEAFAADARAASLSFELPRFFTSIAVKDADVSRRAIRRS